MAPVARAVAVPAAAIVPEVAPLAAPADAAPVAAASPMRAVDVAELLVLATLWGCAYLFMRAAVPAFGPAPLIALRMAIAVALLLPILAWRGGLPSLRTDAWPIVVLGAGFTALPFLLIAWAARTMPAGTMAILNATAPLFTAIVAWVWLGERVGGLRALGLAVGFAGVVLLVWGKASFAAGGAGPAVLAMIGASVFWGVGANYTRRRLSRTDTLAVATGSLLAASLAVAPFAAWQWPAAPIGLRAWLEMAFLGVASSGIGFLMYFRLLRRIGTVRAMSVTFLNPLVAMVAGALYLGEAVTPQMLAGCAVILAGTALTLGLVDGALFRRAKAVP
jgi:drug/metabolite transporter (DMT)-like permease